MSLNKYAILSKKDDSILAVNVPDVGTMVAIFLDEATANKALYKNDFDDKFYVAPIKANIWKAND